MLAELKRCPIEELAIREAVSKILLTVLRPKTGGLSVASFFSLCNEIRRFWDLQRVFAVVLQTLILKDSSLSEVPTMHMFVAGADALDPPLEAATLALPHPSPTRSRFFAPFDTKVAGAVANRAAHKIFSSQQRGKGVILSALTPAVSVPKAVSGAYAALLIAGLQRDAATGGAAHVAESLLWQRSWKALSAPSVLIAPLCALAGGDADDMASSDEEAESESDGSEADGGSDDVTAEGAVDGDVPLKRPRGVGEDEESEAPTDEGEEGGDDEEDDDADLMMSDTDEDTSAVEGTAASKARDALRRYGGAQYCGPSVAPPPVATDGISKPSSSTCAKVAALACLAALSAECGVEIPMLLPLLYACAGDVAAYSVPAWPALLSRVLVRGADSLPPQWLGAFVRRLAGLAVGGRLSLRVGGFLGSLVRDVVAASPRLMKLIHRRRGATVVDSFEFDGDLLETAAAALSGSLPELGVLMAHLHASVRIPATAVTQSLAAPALSVASSENATTPWCASQPVTHDIALAARSLKGGGGASGAPRVASQVVTETPLGPLF